MGGATNNDDCEVARSVSQIKESLGATEIHMNS